MSKGNSNDKKKTFKLVFVLPDRRKRILDIQNIIEYFSREEKNMQKSYKENNEKISIERCTRFINHTKW